MTRAPRIHLDRLCARLDALARIGATEEGGVTRLALTEEDRRGRDLVVGWMRDLGLEVSVDGIGNVFALRRGREEGPPVVTGSHLDTVRAGGRYDGSLGVLAGLEAVQTLAEAGVATRCPLAVVLFTNEEGARFQPGTLGSLVHAGGLAREEALAVRDAGGASVGGELARIGYAGEAPCGAPRPAAYIELHVEQGPVLEAEGAAIAAVEGVQGVSWTEIAIEGQANHAGTTPMRMRRDAGQAAAAVARFARALALEIGGDQVATVGSLRLEPDIVNVIPGRAVLTVDLRNTDGALLREAEERLARFAGEVGGREGVRIELRRLNRHEPVVFENELVDLVEETARGLGHPVRRMPSGAGHDAQSMARLCPTAMIFVPSAGGVSHNPEEYTAPEDIRAGADVLLHTLLRLAG